MNVNHVPMAGSDTLSKRMEDLDSLLASQQQQIQDIQQVVQDLAVSTTSPTVSITSATQQSALDTHIKELQSQMKQLQLRVVGKGVQIANKTFQSFDDVKIWVTLHLPIGGMACLWMGCPFLNSSPVATLMPKQHTHHSTANTEQASNPLMKPELRRPFKIYFLRFLGRLMQMSIQLRRCRL